MFKIGDSVVLPEDFDFEDCRGKTFEIEKILPRAVVLKSGIKRVHIPEEELSRILNR